MPRTTTAATLQMRMNGRIVGKLDRQSSGAIEFRYAREWLDWKHRMPISLSMPLRDQSYAGAQVTNILDNLLPDDASTRRKIAEEVGAAGTDPFNLVSALGQDCVGAIQFVSPDTPVETATSIDATPLSDTEIANTLRNLTRTPLGINPDEDFRISLAGAQEKCALLWHEDQWKRPHSTTATTHIFKPAIGILSDGFDFTDSVENEFFCSKLIADFGLEVAETEIKVFDEIKSLCVKRFDRHWTQSGRLLRIPQEDLCQALSYPSTQKYQNQGGPGFTEIAMLLRSSDTPVQDQARFFKANLLFWLIGATDGHAKNFSITLSPGGRFTLTPLYDILTAQPLVDDGALSHNKFKMAMSIGNSNHYRINEITHRHFVETGTNNLLHARSIENLIEEIADTAVTITEKTIEKLPSGFPDRIPVSVLQSVKSRVANLTAAATHSNG